MFSAKEKRQCATRELQQRRHVYPRLVAQGKMTQTKADREIAVMQAIADDYEKHEREEEAKGRLDL